MTEQDKCTRCGLPLPSDVHGGLCPACLLKCGLDANTIGYSNDAQTHTRWTPPAVDELASLFPELDIINFIGRGGMGAVYKAREKQLDRLVALKILPPEIGHEVAFAKRFAREAQAMAKLGHPNIVTIYSFGQREKLYFFIMEYVDGLSLRQLLDTGISKGGQGRGISSKEALAIVPQICDALQYAHDQGIVHRDIKPENILLNRAGQVKIADFGLAKLVGMDAAGHIWPTAFGAGPASMAAPDITQADEKVMGTPQYMAPEQTERPGEVDHRADIYSLGVVFYQMLTGELPKGLEKFDAPSRKVRIDVRLDEVVLRALEREPARRYQRVSEVGTQVETIISTSPAMDINTDLTPSATNELSHIEQARKSVKLPATGMMLAAWINLAISVAYLPHFFVYINTDNAILTNLAGELLSPLCSLLSPVICIAGIVAMVGAVRMMELRNRSLAIVAAILSIIAIPGNVIGLPMGIWALVILNRSRQIQAFADMRGVKTATGNRYRWIAGVIGIAISLLPLFILMNTATVQVTETRKRRVHQQPDYVRPPAGQWKAELNCGITVEMLGVSEHPSANQQWWQPDGSPLAQRPYGSPLGQRPFSYFSGIVTPLPGNCGREFAIRLYDLPQKEKVHFKWDFDPPAISAGGHFTTENTDSNYHLISKAAATPILRDAITVKLGVPTGPWTTQFETNSDSSMSGGRNNMSVSFAPAYEKNNKVTVIVAHNIVDQDVRVAALGTDGKEFASSYRGFSSVGDLNQMTCTFPDTQLKNIREFRLQTRPYEWVAFEGVANHPKGSTRTTALQPDSKHIKTDKKEP